MALRKQREINPAEDYGFFGPDSVAWKVWGYPTSLTIGFSRAVVVEELDPNLVASVDRTQDIYKRPKTRYDRTIHYFALVAFGDSRSTSRAADVLVKVHSKAIGTEPYGGGKYDANDPDSQLWILVTGWHSVLKAYEMYGPGKLSEADELQFWEECAIAAELQTCNPDDVPRNRAELHAYYERMRPLMSGSPIAQKAMHHLMDIDQLVQVPLVLRPAQWIVGKFFTAGVIATLPGWMREMGDLPQRRAVDIAVRPVLRAVFAALTLSKGLQLRVLALLSPSTIAVVAPVFRGIEPTNPEVLTPTEARERYGFDKPAEAHLAWRQKQHEKVFGLGEAPSDAGLLESEPVLGRLA
ncbi:oxygenase MpaB family protein [Nocardioides sp. WS12]|uniref:oxygenase MpaB family protein n=1 Tax=Nocardioides sp. WS12 TaxID=2486272 RepID=UPI0015F976CC|nr:oxygenase MpaB family protein [Nocardioides sp. WS12]